MSTKQSQREKRMRERRSKEDMSSISSMNAEEEKQNGKETENAAETDNTPTKKSLEKCESEDVSSVMEEIGEEISTSETKLTEKETENKVVETIGEPEKENGNEAKDIKESESKNNSDEMDEKESESKSNSDEVNKKESESKSNSDEVNKNESESKSNSDEVNKKESESKSNSDEVNKKESESRIKSDVQTAAEASNSKDAKATTNENIIEEPFKESWQYKLETPAQCLHALISTSKLSDLTIIVKDDEPYKVHRLILSMRSPFWEKKLYKEKFEGDTITLIDEQALPFKHVLTYMYTGKTKFPDVQIAMSVYQLAHKYQMGNLMDICSQFLMSFISTSNVPEVFKCATLLGDTQLLYKCIQIMEVSPDAVFTAKTFISMCRVSVARLIEQELTVSSEVIVFEALLRWGRSKLESNKEEITSGSLRTELMDFLPKVRFLTMTLEEFVKHVMPSGVLSLEEMREIQLNIVNASSDLPAICNPKREKRKNTSDTVPSKKAKNNDIRKGSPGVSHENNLTKNSSQQGSIQQATSQASTSLVPTSCNPITEQVPRLSTSTSSNSTAEQVSRLSGQAFVQQIPNRAQPTVVTTCQQTQVPNMGNTVGSALNTMASRIQQVQQTWTPGGGLTTVSQSASMMRATPQGAAAFVGLVRTPLGPRLYTMPHGHHTNFQR